MSRGRGWLTLARSVNVHFGLTYVRKAETRAAGCLWIIEASETYIRIREMGMKHSSKRQVRVLERLCPYQYSEHSACMSSHDTYLRHHRLQ